jgi:hypothetical protein
VGVLDDDVRAFISGPVSILAAAADPQRRSTLVRALGCQVEGDRVRLVLARSQAGELIDDLLGGSAIAVVFSRPSTNQTVQLKGTSAHLEPLRAGDGDIIERYCERLVDEIAGLGFAPIVPRTMLLHEATDRIVVSFTASAAFEQTPGPKAGAPLKTPS